MNAPSGRQTLKGLSPLKLALAARNAREQSQALLRADPIAIIGMGCRLPGGVDGPESFWTLLENGIDAVTEVPPGRWDVEGLYDPDPAAPGKTATKWGGFVGDIDRFDAGFFGILRREAERMDPQQRLFLEVAIEALDHAGLPREKLAGSRAGVFIASYYNDYAQLAYQDPDRIDARTLTGTVHSVLANRLSYLLDLRGPSISVDTACSSSLVAIHLACQSLRFGDCDMAVAGGVSLMITESLMISLSKVGFMAPDGRCKSFDASADGFGRGEGCGVIVLKRLSDAIADGDRVLALIRGSSVNQDGRSTVLAAPNGLAQQALIREALENAQVDASRIGYVEAHGTGTALGDPIEVEALAATVGVPAPGAASCLLGTAKANVGHLEAASGVTGVIKSVLVLQKGVIPPQVHFTRLNPHISLSNTRLSIPTALTPWPASTDSRCAGVSGFGVGGTNAHLILEEAPKLPFRSRSSEPGKARLLPLSAQSPAALAALAERWLQALQTGSQDVGVLCACAGARRSHYDHRLAVVGRTAGEMAQGLQAFVDGSATGVLASGSVAAASSSRLAFVFSGQGQQWLGMGRDLLESEPAFRAALEDIDRRFQVLAGWSIIDALGAPENRSRLDETEVAQPAIFALQVALARLWESWGYVADGVVGHSVGEIAALHVAGVIDLDEALRIVLHRARAMQRATGTGAMVALAVTEAEALRHVDRSGGALSIAAINGPRSVVLSGGLAAVEALVATLEAAGIQHKVLPVDYAFHSAQMEPYAIELEEKLGTIRTAEPALAVYSTVTGARLAFDLPARAVDAAYFGRNIRATVRFADAIDAMLEDGFDTFLEIAATPVLAASVAECAAAGDRCARVLPSLRRGRSGRETLLQAGAWLYATLHAPAWDAIHGGAAEVADLPAYPWQRERYWLPEAADREDRLPGRGPSSGNELLGSLVAAADALIFEASWPQAAPQWLAEHRIGGRLLMPAAGMVEALRAAAAQALSRSDLAVTDFIVHQALVLGEPGEPPVRWQTIARIRDDGRAALTMHQAVGGTEGTSNGWRMIASATAGADTDAHSAPGSDAPAGGLAIQEPTTAMSDAVPAVYSAFESVGVAFGSGFRVLQAVAWREGGGVAWLRRRVEPGPPPQQQQEQGLHPTMLDGALQACVVVGAGAGNLPGALMLPVGIERYQVFGTVPERLCAHVVMGVQGDRASVHATVRLTDEQGGLIALVEGAHFIPASPDSLGGSDRDGAWNHELHWQADAVPDAALSKEPSARQVAAWIVCCDAGGQGEALACRLEAEGDRCLRVAGGTSQAVAPGTNVRIDSQQQAGWNAVFADRRWRQGLPLAGVVHLFGLDGGTRAADGNADGSADASASVMLLIQAMAACDLSQVSLTLVTRGAHPVAGPAAEPRGAGLWGLHGVIAVEHPEFNCRIVDLDPDAPMADAGSLAGEVMAGINAPGRVAIRGGKRLLPRLRRMPPAVATARSSRLQPGLTGTIDELAWHGFSLPAPGPDDIVVRVAAAGVNFRDVLLTLGMYPGTGAALGAECSGWVVAVGHAVRAFKPGDAVFGFVPHSLATEVVASQALFCKLPESGLTMERAAALPVAFLTAMFGLQQVAGIRAGQRVLIHAAAGGVGMAAVQIARRAGAEVLATAGSESKRALLKELGVVHVFDSRSLDFVEDVRKVTGGAGVDIVLNSLAGDFIPASIGVLAPGGWFLELGKRDIWSAPRFAQARPDARYLAYDLGDEAQARPAMVQPMLESILAGLADASLEPLPARVYAFEESAEAFRFMAQARHVGKLVLRSDRPRSFPRMPHFPFHADATYLVSGGLGGLGLEAARWLGRKGVRHLTLVGRHPPGGEAEAAIDVLRGGGVDVQVAQADVADEAAMRALLAQVANSGFPLRGVFHAAGTLEDGVLMRQSAARFESAFRGKAAGARVLDSLTRSLPLDCFVLFSSAANWLGAPGQGPYAAANAEAEGIVRARIAAGLPGLSVAWGQWRDAGMAARMARAGNDAWTERGLGWIAPQEGFARLERLLSEGATSAIVLPIDWGRFLGRLPAGVDRDFFAESASAGKPAAVDDRPGAPKARVSRWLALAESQRRGAVLDHATEQALSVLGLDAATRVDPRSALKDLGLDSLMAVELRNVLTRSVAHTLSATLLFDYPSLDALTDYLMHKLNLIRLPEAGIPAGRHLEVAASAQAASRLTEIAGMTDAEADEQLLAELEGAPARGVR